MSSAREPLYCRRARRRIVFAMALAILIAGIAQAAHFHKDEMGHFGGQDEHCLLCIYAGGTAALPTLPALPTAPPAFRNYRPPHSLPCPERLFAASYDARGPPVA